MARLDDCADQAKKTPGVTSALPLIEQPLMASANGRVEGVLVRGMRPADISANAVMNENVRSGDLRTLTPGSNRVVGDSKCGGNVGKGFATIELEQSRCTFELASAQCSFRE